MEINLPQIITIAFKEAVLKLWPYLLILVVPVFLKVLYIIYKLYRLSKAGMYEIDKMDGQTFEKYLATLFQKLGYKVQRVGSFAGDYGADLIIEIDNIKTAVQAKRYINLVGIDSVREVGSAINMYQCNNSMVVTNSYFTEQAKKLAKANDVILWDRRVLAEKILTTK